MGMLMTINKQVTRIWTKPMTHLKVSCKSHLHKLLAKVQHDTLASWVEQRKLPVNSGDLWALLYCDSDWPITAQKKLSGIELVLFLKVQFCKTVSPKFRSPIICYDPQLCTDLQAKIGLSSVLRPRQHGIGYMGDDFYRSEDPTNSIEVLKEQIVHRAKFNLFRSKCKN